jgi:hypothetical protein
MKIEEYIDTHCIAGNDKVKSKLPIRVINNLSLKIIVLILTRITRSSLLHQTSRPLMFYSIECLRLVMYDWCISLLANTKSQLTEWKQGNKRNFGFASILCIFFFERFLGLGPRVMIIPKGSRVPSMAWWTELMRRQLVGRVPTPHNDYLFY